VDSQPELKAPPPFRRSLIIGLITCSLGFLTVTAFRGSTQDTLLTNARESDLVVLLDSLTQRAARLQYEQQDLQKARDEILSGSGKAALARTRQQLFDMQVLNGTVAVHGPGLLVTISDPTDSVTYDVLLAVVQELRDAGAEAVDINGVRLNGRSWFSYTQSGKLTVNDTTVNSPLKIKVIGSAKTMSVALRMAGGVSDTVASLGAKMIIVEKQDLAITTTVPTA